LKNETQLTHIIDIIQRYQQEAQIDEVNDLVKVDFAKLHTQTVDKIQAYLDDKAPELPEDQQHAEQQIRKHRKTIYQEEMEAEESEETPD
jgi:hypothetical protein